MKNKILCFLNYKRLMEFSDFKYITVLACWILLFFSTFVFSLLPPQYGWWHYYGWQISEGAVLYKDLYCFLMPYYVWLHAGLYSILSEKLLLYYALGVCFDIAAAICIFKIIADIVPKTWGILFAFTRAVLQYSYLMYLPLDYNVFIADIVVVGCRYFNKFSSCGKAVA